MQKIVTIAIVTLLLQLTSFHVASAAELEISGAFARASAGPARNGAVFLTVKNHGKGDDTLISASTDVSKRAALHGHSMKDGIMRMSQVKGGIPVSAGSVAHLKPGGFHVMLMGLKSPLKKGKKITVTLTFKSTAKIKVDVPILGVGAKSSMKHGDMKHDGMMKKEMKHKY
jgi:periplasmic copper chaperone A